MRRTLRSLAALIMLALIVAGCSNASAGTGGSAGSTNVVTGSSSGGSTSPVTGSGGATTAAAGTGSGGSGGATSAVYEQALKFSECMRANGISNFPDPDASGSLTIDQVANGSSVDTSTTAFKQALSACRNLEPAGFTGSQRSPEQQQAALKFAQCVRDNGVPDFPDPAPDGPLIDTNRIPSSNSPAGRSALHAAMQKCRDFAAAAGVPGGQ